LEEEEELTDYDLTSIEESPENNRCIWKQ
jgi:hypothetical protein